MTLLESNQKLNNKYFIYFFSSWIWCVFSSLISENIIFSLKSSLPYIRIAIIAIFISFFIYFLGFIFVEFYKKYFAKEKNFSDYRICLLASLLITLWPILPNGNVFTNGLMILYGFQMGFFLKKHRIYLI